MNARITFKDNPWPEGHPATLSLCVSERDGRRGLDIGLQTADYSAEREAPDPGEGAGDWQAPIVWNNFHRASFEGWIPLPQSCESLADLDGVRLEADHDKLDGPWDWDELAFDHCYLLGHDAVAGHTLEFRRVPEGLSVRWTGRAALAYVGDYAFKYSFELVGTMALGSGQK